MRAGVRAPASVKACAHSERVAFLHAEHARALERRVSVSAPQTIEDACAFAWLQLLTRPHVAVARGPALLRWLEQTATREAWRIEARSKRDGLHGDIVLERLSAQTVPGADELGSATRADRRGREIAAEERVSLTTANKQIARAKRLLRAADVDAPARAHHAGRPGRAPGAGCVAPKASVGSR